MRGHIRRRSERSWELKFDTGVDALTGKRLTKYHSFKGTKREAQAELVRLMETARQGIYVDPSKATLSDFLDRWERDWAAINVSPKTAERYAELLRVHIRPHLGALPVQKLQPDVSMRSPPLQSHLERLVHHPVNVANGPRRKSLCAAWPPFSQELGVQLGEMHSAIPTHKRRRWSRRHSEAR